MRKMPLNQIAFGKTDAFNELNTFGQEYFMESFVANPKYHIDDFLSGSRFFVCGKKGTGKSALLKYLECHFLKDESNLVFPIRFKSEIEQVDKDSFEEIASAPDNSTKNEKYDTSSILDQSSNAGQRFAHFPVRERCRSSSVAGRAMQGAAAYSESAGDRFCRL